MTLVGNNLKFRVRVNFAGKVTLSGDILAPDTGHIILYFDIATSSPSAAGLQQFEDGGWGLRIDVQGNKRQTFHKEFSFPKLAGREIPITVKPALGLELASIKIDQWAVDRSVFVHGGCVSRDAFEASDAPPLAGYRARSSFVAAFDEAETGIPRSSLDANPSAFQRRMLQTELERELPGLLKAGTFDFMLVDLIVERTALAKTEYGGIVTKSPEFLKTGLGSFIVQELDNKSDFYFEAFRDAWMQLVEMVGETRLIVNRVYWATHQINGEKVPKSSSVDFQNQRLDKLYEIISQVSPSVFWINYSNNLLRADGEHKWGPAPYHFGREFYMAQRAAIRAIALGQVTGRTQPASKAWARGGVTSLTAPMRLPVVGDLGNLVVRLILAADDTTAERNALVSFDLRDAEGEAFSEGNSVAGLAFSQKPGIGWFAYVPTRQGVNAWSKMVNLPEGITCRGVTLHLWGNRKSDVSVSYAHVSPA